MCAPSNRPPEAQPRRPYAADVRRAAFLPLVAAVALAAGCASDTGESVKGPPPQAPPLITLDSPAFQKGGKIPKQFTCDGDDRSPPLRWSGVPKGAKDLALLVEDPGTRGGIFVHWSAWEIPPATTAIDGRLPDGARQGANSFGEARYDGPCPPKGDDPHRYSYIVYALSAPLGLEKGAGAREVRKKIAGLAIARGETFGTYGR